MDSILPTVAMIYCLLGYCFPQTENADMLESCNVVCNCNTGQANDPNVHPTRHLTNQGPPGKLGPKGGIGPVGAKGEKGDTGLKGDKGTDADDVLISHILGAMSVSSCQELLEMHHINETGYYLMKSKRTLLPLYRYCDFRIYRDVVTCKQLVEKYNVTNIGDYIYGGNLENSIFRRCYPPVSGVYTCQALLDRNPELNAEDSGPFEFRPSGQQTAFAVHCNFTGSQAVTEIHHDMMLERQISSSCEDRGCYSASPQYEAIGRYLEDVVENSVSCKQFIKLRCQGVRFRSDDYSWWVSRSGEKMLYWGGSTRDNYCACGESNSCADKAHNCNCDENSENVIRTDEGYLTDKSKLPVREIRVGDMGGDAEIGWYAIGELECVGQV